MRRLILLAAPLVAGSLFLTGCGSDEVQDTPTPSARKSTGGGPNKVPKGSEQELDAPTTGILRGKVVIATAPPAEPEIAAMKTHNDHAVCLAAPEREKVEQTWLVDKNGGVSDVLIRLIAPAGKKFKAIEPAKKEAIVDQPFCAFVPHVQVVKPGQSLKVTNTSGAVHNTKMEVDPSTGEENQNLTIPPGDSRTVTLKPQKSPVALSCQIHSWMSGKVYVSDNPYVAVTKDDGSFEIANVPVGVELSVVGIHDDANVEGGKEGIKHTFKAGDNEITLKVTKK